MATHCNMAYLAKVSVFQRTVLVVDDDPMFLRLAKRILSADKRIRLNTAQNSAQAFEKITINTDLVLMEMNLGQREPTGPELVSSLRKQGFDGVISMLTSDDNPKRLFEAFRTGVNDYLIKSEVMENSFKDQVCRLLFPEEESPNNVNLFDNAYLHTKGLGESRINLLHEYFNAGFPDLADFAQITCIPKKTLCQRLTRVEKQLGVTNKAQLACLLTTLATRTWRRVSTKNEVETTCKETMEKCGGN